MVKIKFLGATHQVTGSCYLLDAEGAMILVDCGLFQEHDYLQRNWEPFPFQPSQLQYLVLTHAHLDHCGLVPKLVREGFSGEILLTPASKELLPIVILDSAHMQEEDADFERRRYEREGRNGQPPRGPLYTVEEAERCFPLLREVPYEEPIQLNDRVRLCLHEAGHILGSAMTEFKVMGEAGEQTIIFSGDIGQWNAPLLPDPHLFDTADYVVMESTYGDRDHDGQQDIDERITRIVNETVSAGGNLLIPASATERAQDLLYHFNRLAKDKAIPYVMFFLDSPMAIKITEVFERSIKYLDEEAQALFSDGNSPFNFPGLKLVDSVEASKAINQIRGSAIIMAGSGMITGGRIEHHLAMNITSPESVLLFVGYQATGTLGEQILHGASSVRIHGESYPVRIRVEEINAFSAHSGKTGLQRWISNLKFPPRHIFLTHGEEGPIMSLKSYIQSKGWAVSAPAYLEEFEL